MTEEKKSFFVFDRHTCTPARFWHLDKGSGQEGWTGNPIITEAGRGSVGGSPGAAVRKHSAFHTSPVWRWLQSLPINLAKTLPFSEL